MSKTKRNKGPGKRTTTTNKNDIFKKYAAPWSKNFLYFDKLQECFFQMVKDK